MILEGCIPHMVSHNLGCDSSDKRYNTRVNAVRCRKKCIIKMYYTFFCIMLYFLYNVYMLYVLTNKYLIHINVLLHFFLNDT